MSRSRSRIVRTIGSALVAILCVLTAGFDHVAAQSSSANFTLRYDLDSTTLTYCRLMGQGNNPFGGSIQSTAKVKTTGSDVAITAVTAGQNPFLNIGVDDVVAFYNSANTFLGRRTVATRTDADNITVDTAINLDTTAGYNFRWWDLQCGTGDTDGWIEAGGAQERTATFYLEQISGVTGGIDVRWECQGEAMGSLPVPYHPGATAGADCSPGTLASGFCNFTTAGATTGRLGIAAPSALTSCARYRVGIKINTADAAEAVEGDNERITITFDGVKVF